MPATGRRRYEHKCWQSARSIVNVVAMTPGVATIEQHKSDLAEQCRRFGVQRLEIFGSAPRGDFDPARSDFDFVVSFADKTPGTYADRYLDFANALECLFGRKVDLLTERSIRNPYFEKKIGSERRVVYDRRDQEAVA